MPSLPTLYTYWRSSCSYRVRIALGVKGVAHRSVPVNLLRREQTQAEHVARSPLGFVPALVVDGRVLVESVAIVELLEELHPEPALYPRDPLDRADVRALVEVVNAGTQPLQNLVVLDRVSADKAARDAWSQHFIARGLGGLERLMERNEARGVRGPYAYGASLTAADVFLVPQVYNARRFGVDLSAFPRVAAADAAARALEAVAAAAPEKQPDATAT